MCSWPQWELSTLNLGDTRRNERIRFMVEQMAIRPGVSVPEVFETHAEITAAYRALGSEATDPEAIRSAQRDACLGRMAGESVILAIQDTTSFNFTAHPATEGIGLIGDRSKGFLAHHVLAVSESGIPLGLWHQQVWTRDPDAPSTRDTWRERPLEQKESFRWVQALRAVHETMPAHATVVTIGDREADIYEMFAEPRPEGSELLIRNCSDRRLAPPERRLWETVERVPVSGEFSISLRRHPERAPRDARLQVRFCSVTLDPPRFRVGGVARAPVTVQAIAVQEVSPAKTPIRWLLLTTLPVESFDAARACVRYYTLRWLIERYHYILKSGCKLEESQLRSVDRLERLLALCCVVAWRLLWLTYAARAEGDQPCTVAFTELEWRTLYHVRHGQPPLGQPPPPLREAVRWLGGLGGHPGRKGDAEPGVKVLWRGLMRLQDIVLGVLLVTGQDVCNA